MEKIIIFHEFSSSPLCAYLNWVFENRHRSDGSHNGEITLQEWVHHILLLLLHCKMNSSTFYTYICAFIHNLFYDVKWNESNWGRKKSWGVCGREREREETRVSMAFPFYEVGMECYMSEREKKGQRQYNLIKMCITFFSGDWQYCALRRHCVGMWECEWAALIIRSIFALIPSTLFYIGNALVCLQSCLQVT